MKLRTALRLNAFLLACLLTLLCGGCMYSSVIITETADEAAQSQPIHPEVNTQTATTRDVTLYFRFENERLLSSTVRTIEVRDKGRIEEAVVRALLDGPELQRRHLTSVIPSGTRLISTSGSGNSLLITLSREFLNLPADVPLGWEQDPAWVEYVNATRLLAIASIVNSVTECGNYNRVQILIDNDGNGQGVRVARRHMGYCGQENQDSPVDVFLRNNSYILTPETAVSSVFRYLSARNFEKLLLFVADYDADNTPKPSVDALPGELDALYATIETYEVLGSAVSEDGSSAVVTASYTRRNAQGRSTQVQMMPIQLVRESGAWRIHLSTLKKLLNDPS